MTEDEIMTFLELFRKTEVDYCRINQEEAAAIIEIIAKQKTKIKELGSIIEDLQETIERRNETLKNYKLTAIDSSSIVTKKKIKERIEYLKKQDLFINGDFMINDTIPAKIEILRELLEE
jgi:hypothetical protein